LACRENRQRATGLHPEVEEEEEEEEEEEGVLLQWFS
jgi:hypothetical protein